MTPEERAAKLFAGGVHNISLQDEIANAIRAAVADAESVLQARIDRAYRHLEDGEYHEAAFVLKPDD